MKADSMTKTTTQTSKRSTRVMEVCKRQCPGGTRCCLDRDVPHQLCVCNDEECPCHSRERYEGERNAQVQASHG